MSIGRFPSCTSRIISNFRLSRFSPILFPHIICSACMSISIVSRVYTPAQWLECIKHMTGDQMTFRSIYQKCPDAMAYVIKTGRAPVNLSLLMSIQVSPDVALVYNLRKQIRTLTYATRTSRKMIGGRCQSFILPRLHMVQIFIVQVQSK